MGRVTVEIGIQRPTKVPEGRQEGGRVLAVLRVVDVGVEARVVVATEDIATTTGLFGVAAIVTIVHGTGRRRSSRSCGKLQKMVMRPQCSGSSRKGRTLRRSMMGGRR